MKFILQTFALFLFLVPAASAATLTVNKLADTNDGVCDADCSLREAIAQANASPGDDTIVFDGTVFAGSQKITLASALGQLSVTDTTGALTINGPGAARLAISGGNLIRVLSVAAGASLSLDRLTVTEGRATGFIDGGGIYNQGNLTLTRSAITACSSDRFGGGIMSLGTAATVKIASSILSDNSTGNSGSASGGAILSTGGSLVVTNSTISNNSSLAGVNGNAFGGGISTYGDLTVSNSVIAGNIAASAGGGNVGGGGIFSPNGNIDLTNSTLVSNLSSSAYGPSYGGALNFTGMALKVTNCTFNGNAVNGNPQGSFGGGIISGGRLTVASIRNTIIAGNTTSSTAGNDADVSGQFVSLGNNLIGKTDGTTGFTQPTDRTGTTASPLDPRLGPLGLFGGLTMTMPLLSGSPAIDNGNSCVADLSCAANNPTVALASDQRGAGRVGAVDIGAFETNNTTINGGTFGARLPDATTNQSYNLTLIPDTGAATVCLAGGALPPGITGVAPCFSGLQKSSSSESAPAVLAPATLAGTPTSSGGYFFSLRVSGGGNATVVNYFLPVSLVPTAAPVDVGGRVSSNGGRAVANATVTLTKANGETVTARTNSFGFYKFKSVESAQTVVLTVQAKGKAFEPRIVALSESLADLDFTAL